MVTGHGWSPLFLAAAADSCAMVDAMTRLGASVREECHGRNLLHHAAACGAVGAVSLLAGKLPLDAVGR